MKPLALAICLLIWIGSFSTANAQACAPQQTDAVSDERDKMANSSQNILNWQKNNSTNRQYESVEAFYDQIVEVELMLSHVVDLLFINDLNRDNRLEQYVNLRLSHRRQAFERQIRTMHDALSRISHPYVVSEGRVAIAILENVTRRLGGCNTTRR